MAVVGSAYVVVSAITTGFQSQVNNAANSMQNVFATAGKNSGKSFTKMFTASMSDFQRESMAAYAAINGLIRQSYYLQGAIGLLIPAIGAAAGGLSVMAFQAAAAAPSFIVLGGVLAGLAQGMVGVKLAFSGIGKAVGAITKPGGGVDRMPQLLRAQRDAVDNVTSAEKRLKKAMEAVTEAREEARREIERLKYDNEDAVISEKRAVIELEKARQALLRVQDLPPNSRARREAELAYQEADLNLRRSRSNVFNLNKDLNKTTQNGTLSADQQIENSKRVVDANEAIVDAANAVTRANENKLLADKELQDAKAGKGQGGGQDPFAGLNEFQKDFAKFIAGMKPRIDQLKLAVSRGFLPALENAIRLLDTKLFPILKRRLEETGVALGKAAMDFAKSITTPAAAKNFDTVLGTGNYVISRAGEIIGNLARLLLALLAAADPLIRRFTDWIDRLTGGWADSAEENITGLTDMFNRAGDIAADFGTIIGNIVGAFVNIGKAIAGEGGAGQSMMDWLISITQGFEDFTAKHLASGKLQEYFQTAWDGFKQILIIVGDIVAAILKTGGEESFEGSVKTIGEGISAILEKVPELVKGGAAFAGYVSNFLKMTAAFIESGSVQLFFGIVSTAVGAVADFLSIPLVAKIFGFISAFHGLRLGIMAVSGAFNFFVVKYIVGAFKSFQLFIGKIKFAAFAVKYYATIVKNSAVVQRILNAAMKANPIGLWIIAIMAVIAILVVMYKKFDWFRNFVDGIWKGIKAGLDALWGAMKYVGEQIASFFAAIWGGIKAAWDAVWPALVIAFKIAVGLIMLPFMLMAIAISGAWQGIKAAWDLVWPLIYGGIQWAWENVIKPVFDLMLTIFKAVWDGIKLAFTFVWDIIKNAITFYWNLIIKPIFQAMQTVFTTVWNAIKTAFMFVWNIIKDAITFYWTRVIKPIFEAFGTIFSKVWDGIKTAFQKAWSFITGVIDSAKTVFGKIGDAIISAFKGAINFIIRGWNKIEFKIPGFKVGPVGYDGFTLGLPDIPQLAKGGVVMPSAGGTLARLAEAGRPERIEPLDDDGLSKRDRAIISMLSGGGGQTFNVYPAPKMDEVELAAIISRQLAFQLRAGSV